MARKAEGWTLQTDKRTGNKIVQFRIAGKKYRRSTRTADPVEAKVIGAGIYAGEIARRQSGLEENPDMAWLFGQWVDEVADDWSRDYRRTQPNRILRLVEEFPTMNDVRDLKRQRAFRARRLKEVLRATLCEDLVPLRVCLAWAYDEGLITEPVEVPLPDKSKTGTRAHDRRRVDLTDAQTEALIAALPVKTRAGHPARDVFTVAWETGLRHGGVFRLETPRHFRRGVRELYLTADIDKNGWERAIDLTERSYKALERHAPDIGPIFEAWDYRKTLRGAGRAIGLHPDDVASLDLRDFRHAASTDGADKSGDLTGLSYTAGWTNPNTASRYVHPKKRRAKELLNKRFPSNGTPNGTPSAEPEEDAC
jgi:hypothetical protein